MLKAGIATIGLALMFWVFVAAIKSLNKEHADHIERLRALRKLYVSMKETDNA